MEDYPVRITDAKRPIFLVRLPDWLSEDLRRSKENDIFAEISDFSDQSQDVKTTMKLIGKRAETLPSEFEISLKPEENLHVFRAKSDEKGDISWQGIVKYRGEVKPVQTAKYRAFLKKRTELKQIKPKTAQPAAKVIPLTELRTKRQAMPAVCFYFFIF